VPGAGVVSCGKSALIEALSHLVKDLDEEVSRLCVIRKDEEEIDWVFTINWQR